MRHSQNTFINMIDINTKNDISFSIMLSKRSIWLKKIYIHLCGMGLIIMLDEEILLLKFLLTLEQGGASLVDHLCFFVLFFVILSCASVYWCLVVTCWERAYLLALSFVISNCELVTFPLLSLVRCGAWLYRFLIFALFLTFLLLSNHWIDKLNFTIEWLCQSLDRLSSRSQKELFWFC